MISAIWNELVSGFLGCLGFEPRNTVSSFGLFSWTQWAAVRTHWLLIRDPPQNMDEIWTKAIQGHLPAGASAPPIILVLSWGRPQTVNWDSDSEKQEEKKLDVNYIRCSWSSRTVEHPGYCKELQSSVVETTVLLSVIVVISSCQDNSKQTDAF